MKRCYGPKVALPYPGFTPNKHPISRARFSARNRPEADIRPRLSQASQPNASRLVPRRRSGLLLKGLSYQWTSHPLMNPERFANTRLKLIWPRHSFISGTERKLVIVEGVDGWKGL